MAAKTVERPFFTTVAATLSALVLAATLVKYGPAYALALLVLPVIALVFLGHPRIGILAAIAITLAIPHSVSHVWLLPPMAIVLALLGGTVRPRLHTVDLVVIALVLCLWLSWLINPQNGITTKTFLEGTLPFAPYFG